MDRRASLHNASHRSPFIVPADEVKMAAAKSSSLETILLHRYRNFFFPQEGTKNFLCCLRFFLSYAVQSRKGE